MKKGKAFFITTALIEVLAPSVFVLLLYRPYPPWITGLFGLNSTFSRIGTITVENSRTR